jgi:aspartyl-tRNA(Asn)/glutamyl-tRNA(Gln) amidotransferase subunit C
MAKLSKEDVLKLARLARLHLTDDEVVQFQEEISAILGYVEQLQSVKVDGIEPTYQVTGLNNVMRPDEERLYAAKEELLKNVPAKKGDYIKVRRMLT